MMPDDACRWWPACDCGEACRIRAVDAPTALAAPGTIRQTDVPASAPDGPRAGILGEAYRLTRGDRQAAYGHPLDDYTCTGQLWGAILTRAGWQPGDPIPAETAALMMVAVKVSREAGRHKPDNLVDGAGYLSCVEMIHDERQRRGAERG